MLRRMTTKVSVGGVIASPDEARLSPLDRGFLYGDSVYEVLRTYGGRLFALDEHLARLGRSAEAIALDLPAPASLEAELRRTLAAAGNAESYVRLQISRGVGAFGLDPALSTEPTTVVIVRELTPPPPETYTRGVVASIVGRLRNPRAALDPGAKTGNYLNNLLALREAKADGADEALLRDAEGRLTEGATSNVFAVHGGVVTTPPLATGLLDGVTRAHVLLLCRELGIRARELDLRPAELAAADEAFLTSSVRELVPIVELRGAVQGRIGTGAPGPISLRLHGAYRAAALKAAR